MGIPGFFSQDFGLKHHRIMNSENKKRGHIVIDVLTFMVGGRSVKKETFKQKCNHLFFSILRSLKIIQEYIDIIHVTFVVDGPSTHNEKKQTQEIRKSRQAEFINDQLRFGYYECQKWFPIVSDRIERVIKCDVQLVHEKGEADENVFVTSLYKNTSFYRNENKTNIYVLTSDSDILLRLSFNPEVSAVIRRTPLEHVIFYPTLSDIYKSKMLKYALLRGTDYFIPFCTDRVNLDNYPENWISMLKEESDEKIIITICEFLKKFIKVNEYKMDIDTNDNDCINFSIYISKMFWFLCHVTKLRTTPILIESNYIYERVKKKDIIELCFKKPELLSNIIKNISY